MPDKRAERAARAAAAAQLRADQERRDRQRRSWIIGTTAALVVALIGVSVAVILGESREQAAIEAAANQPIDGVEEFSDLSANHVPSTPEPTADPTVAAADEPVGTALPPVGGDHDPVWQNCGIYAEPVGTGNAIHSLEHGAVWVTYRPGLPAEQLDVLTDLARGKPYMLLSPFPDLKSPVVLTAWGVQLELDDASDPRAATFVEKYLQGEQTPEPGAACSGGVGAPSV